MSGRDAFTAIADPTRRRILALLRDHGTMPAGDIATHFTATSRPGISRHLRVLRECGVVRAERVGKEQRYMVDPRPLAEIRDGFLAGFATMHFESLSALRSRIECP